MVRLHPGAPANVTCVWAATPDIEDEIGQHLICWAGPANVNTRTIPHFHYEVPKALCGTNGPLTFTEGGPDQCPIGDDLTISAADPLDPSTCQYEPPPGSTIATWEDDNQFSGQNSFTGQTFFNNNVYVTGDLDITGQTTHNGDLGLIGLLSVDGEISSNGGITSIGPLAINQPDAATIGAIVTQNNPVISTDANMLEFWYLGENTLRLNEIGLLRVITPPASTGLGKEGEVTAQFHAGTPTTPAIRVHNSNGTATIIMLGNGTATFTGNVEAPNTTKGAYQTITVDSTTVPGRYAAGTPAPAVRVEGGDVGRMLGKVTIASGSGIGDVIASAIPVAARPSVDRDVFAGVAGAGAQIRISAAGVLTIQRSAQTGTLSLDGVTYSL